MNPIHLCIAGHCVALEWDCVEAAASFASLYQAFLAPGKPPEARIRIRHEPGSPFIAPIYGQPIVIEVSYRHGGQGGFDFVSHWEAGRFDAETGQGELTLRQTGNPENYLRVLFAWRGLRHEMLILHAAGIVRDGRAFVFVGHSGAGKTTAARLSLQYTVLSDDLVALKRVNGRYWAYGTGFQGEALEAPRTNARAPLACISLLRKAPEHRFRPLNGPQAVAGLAACVPFVSRDAHQSQRVIDLCADVIHHVPVGELTFRRDPGFWEVLDGLEHTIS